jgi:hypothetical protein
MPHASEPAGPALRGWRARPVSLASNMAGNCGTITATRFWGMEQSDSFAMLGGEHLWSHLGSANAKQRTLPVEGDIRFNAEIGAAMANA